MNRLFPLGLALATGLLPCGAAQAQPVSSPRVAFGANGHGYGVFACLQRAENQLYRMGAASVSRSDATIWGRLGETTIAVLCRNNEAITIGAGPEARFAVDQIRPIF